MAKKTVATLKQVDTSKGYAKVIRAVKSEKTGAYAFKEDIVPVVKVQEILKG
jgi:hypothetical protein